MRVKQNLDKNWKNSFNAVAQLYDLRRPGYPEKLFDKVIEYAGLTTTSHLLEVGAGTGKATVAMAKRGMKIEAVELGAEMAQVARQNCSDNDRVNIVVSSFEDFKWNGTPFDLLYSAQAFHWIDPELRYKKSHAILKPGGSIALFWNMAPEGEDRLHAALDEHYKTFAPHMANFGRKRSFADTVQEGVDEINQSNLFHDVEVVQFPPQVNSYTADEYLELLGTYSDHINLEPEAHKKLLSAIHNSINNAGGVIKDSRIAVLYLGRRN